jgi:hypothetical protein
MTKAPALSIAMRRTARQAVNASETTAPINA